MPRSGGLIPVLRETARVRQPLLAAQPDSDHHYVNLLTGDEIDPVEVEGGHALSFRLRRESAAIVARLPKALAVEGERVTGEGGIIVVDDKGSRLATANSGATLPDIGEENPHMIKLLRDGRLVDAVVWPEQ